MTCVCVCVTIASRGRAEGRPERREVLVRTRTLAALVALLMLGAVPAMGNHDDGDGLETCNRGEICLYDLASSSRYTNQFYWDAVYGTHYTWYDTVDNHYESWLVDDDMSAVVNKDTTCDVRFKDWRTGATWTVGNDYYWHDAPTYINQAADLHTRVNC